MEEDCGCSSNQTSDIVALVQVSPDLIDLGSNQSITTTQIVLVYAVLLLAAFAVSAYLIPEKHKLKIKEMGSGVIQGFRERRQSRSTNYRKIRTSKFK